VTPPLAWVLARRAATNRGPHPLPEVWRSPHQPASRRSCVSAGPAPAAGSWTRLAGRRGRRTTVADLGGCGHPQS
jgi:hypothetical protein